MSAPSAVPAESLGDEKEPASGLEGLFGCYRIFTDTASGSLESRPELTKVLERLRPGDTLVVWRLDRLGRSIPHLIDQLAALQERGIGFRSLQEAIDTTSSGGRLVFHGGWQSIRNPRRFTTPIVAGGESLAIVMAIPGFTLDRKNVPRGTPPRFRRLLMES